MRAGLNIAGTTRRSVEAVANGLLAGQRGKFGCGELLSETLRWHTEGSLQFPGHVALVGESCGSSDLADCFCRVDETLGDHFQPGVLPVLTNRRAVVLPEGTREMIWMHVDTIGKLRDVQRNDRISIQPRFHRREPSRSFSLASPGQVFRQRRIAGEKRENFRPMSQAVRNAQRRGGPRQGVEQRDKRRVIPVAETINEQSRYRALAAVGCKRRLQALVPGKRRQDIPVGRHVNAPGCCVCGRRGSTVDGVIKVARSAWEAIRYPRRIRQGVQQAFQRLTQLRRMRAHLDLERPVNLSLNCRGGKPKAATNARVMWLWSAKPAAAATSRSGAGLSSSARAAQQRRLVFR